jgi:hypothetical protein
MLDDMPSEGSDMQAGRSIMTADSAVQPPQIATIDPTPISFASAASAADLDADLLASDIAELMLIPVWPEPAPGDQAALPPILSEQSSDDPHALLTMLTGVSLFELMGLSVESNSDWRQELAVTTLADNEAAAFLQACCR